MCGVGIRAFRPNPSNNARMQAEIRIIVLAKLPLAGRVKTRLTPPCTPHEAAAVAEAALRDTLDVVRFAATTRPDRFGETVVVLERFGLETPPWIGTEFRSVDQCAGGLGVRLAHAFSAVHGPAILIGMDTPQVTADLLVEAADALDANDSVIGAAADGGFWIIGFAGSHPNAFDGVAMSTDQTGLDQVLRLKELGLSPQFLPELHDIDVFADACAVASQFLGSRTATAIEEVKLRLLLGEARNPSHDDIDQAHKPAT